MTVTYLILALCMGAALSIYIPMASQSSEMMGSPILGNVPFFAVAFVSSVLIALMSGYRPADIGRVTHVPGWLFLAGAVSAVMVIGASFLVPRIGTGEFFVLLVTGQILIGAVVSQFGLFNVPVQPITLVKAVGMMTVAFGAFLVSFGGSID